MIHLQKGIGAVPEEVAALQAALSSAQARLQQQYTLLGKDIYDITAQHAACINALLEEIITLKSKLNRLHRQQPCPYCQAYNPPQNQFCSRCGHALPAIQEELP